MKYQMHAGKKTTTTNMPMIDRAPACVA